MSRKTVKPVPKPTDNRTLVLVCLGIIVITALAYVRLPGNGFIQYDDLEYITQNRHISGGLTPSGVSWAFQFSSYAANWHPLTWISHMIDVSVFGLNSAGHHSVSLALHILSAVLLFLVLRRMTGSVWRSAFVAALFAVHPLHVESVAWAAERKDVLAGLFWMLTMAAYVLYTEKPRALSYGAVVIFYALGLMAKPMLVTLPFALLLLDWWPLRRNRTWPRLLLEKVPLVVLAGASSAITFLIQRAGGAVATLDIPMSARLGNAAISYLAYIGKTIWPARLAVFYPFISPEELPAMIPKAIAAALVLALLTALAVVYGRTRRYILVGWLFYLGTLVPMIGLVQVGDQAMADRYTYIPLIGLFIIVTWGVGELLKLKPAAAVAPAAAVLLVLSALTFRQVGYWYDSIGLFQHTIEVTDKNYLAYYTLGGYYDKEERFSEAQTEFRKAIDINPRFSPAHNTLGASLMREGDLRGAIGEFKEGLKYSPDDPSLLTNLGSALSRTGQIDSAEVNLDRAIELNPDSMDAHNDLAIVLFQKKDYVGAWREVDICRKNGIEPAEGFIQALTAASGK